MESQLIKISQITVDNYRDPGDVTALARNIQKLGLLYPVIVEKSGKKYKLTDGHRRLLACKSLGNTHIPAVVDVDDNSQAKKFSSNFHRKEPSMMETAAFVSKLLGEDPDATSQEISDLLSIPTQQVNFYRWYHYYTVTNPHALVKSMDMKALYSLFTKAKGDIDAALVFENHQHRHMISKVYPLNPELIDMDIELPQMGTGSCHGCKFNTASAVGLFSGSECTFKDCFEQKNFITIENIARTGAWSMSSRDIKYAREEKPMIHTLINECFPNMILSDELNNLPHHKDFEHPLMDISEYSISEDLEFFDEPYRVLITEAITDSCPDTAVDFFLKHYPHLALTVNEISHNKYFEHELAYYLVAQNPDGKWFTLSDFASHSNKMLADKDWFDDLSGREESFDDESSEEGYDGSEPIESKPEHIKEHYIEEVNKLKQRYARNRKLIAFKAKNASVQNMIDEHLAEPTGKEHIEAILTRMAMEPLDFMSLQFGMLISIIPWSVQTSLNRLLRNLVKGSIDDTNFRVVPWHKLEFTHPSLQDKDPVKRLQKLTKIVLYIWMMYDYSSTNEYNVVFESYCKLGIPLIDPAIQAEIEQSYAKRQAKIEERLEELAPYLANQET